MGKKQKQSQRTKGNLKASSSARAAELLENLGGAQGFGALGGDLGYVPVNQSMEDADSSVDADFRMSMRKLTKRDTTTKIKALQEIAALCIEKDKEEVKSMLPFWPRLYNKLSIDHERRVREATQQTMKEIVSQLGREIAPQLKALMGTWLIAQCDPYGPAANMAKVAFSVVFSPAKQQDTLVFCKTEVISQIEDNILNQTAETLSDKRITEPEDMQNKYERTVACSMSAWKTFLLTVPPQEDLVEVYGNILKQPAFWKFHSHQSELIRSSFYGLISALCQVHQPLILQDYSEKACTCTLYKLDEMSPLVCSTLWEATLHVISTIQDWYTKINPKKGFLPKLWKVLKEGGENSAGVIYPNLLPLLSKMPQDLITDKETHFVETFFETMKQSLSSGKVLQSQRNVDAIVCSFMECIRYCVTQNLNSDGEPMCTMLLEKLGQIIAASVFEQNAKLADSALYEEVAQVLHYFSKLCNENDEGRDKQAVASNVEKALWNIIREIYISSIDKGDHLDEVSSFNRFYLLLCKLRQLAGSDEILIEEMENKNLQELVCDVMVACYRGINDKKCESRLKLFCNLLKIYSYNSVLIHVLHKNKHDTEDRDTGKMREAFLDEILMPAMDISVSCETDQILIGVFADYIIRLQSEKIPIFLHKVLKKIESNSEYVAALTSELLQTEKPEVMKWLQGDEFGETIISIARTMCMNVWGGNPNVDNGEDQGSQAIDPVVDLLTFVLSAGTDSCSVLGSKYIEGVVEELQFLMPSVSMLESNSQEDILKCVEFVSKLASKIFPALKERMMIPCAQTLHLALFRLNCDNVFKSDNCAHLTEAWQKGAECLYKMNKESVPDFFGQAVSCIHEKILIRENNEILHSVSRLNDLCDIAVRLIDCIPNMTHKQIICKQFELAFEVHNFWKIYCSLKEGILQPESKHKKEHDELGSFNMFQLIKPQKSIPEKSMVKCLVYQKQFFPGDFLNVLCPLYFNCKLIENVPSVSDFQENNDNDENAVTKMESNICLGLALCEIFDFAQDSSKSNESKEMGLIKECLEKKFEEHVQCPARKMTLAKYFLQQSLTIGDLWSEGLKLILKNCEGFNEELKCMMDPIDSLCDTTDIKVGYTVLILLDVLPPNELQNFASVMIATVMSSPQENMQKVKGYYLQLALLTKALTRLGKLDLGDVTKQVISDTVMVVAVIQQWQELHEDLFPCDVQMTYNASSWSTSRFTLQVIQFLTAVVEQGPLYLGAKQWDFILCKLIWWLQEMTERPQVIHLHLFNFLTAVCQCMEKLNIAEPEMKTKYKANPFAEWKEFFSTQALQITVKRLLTISIDNEFLHPHPKLIQSMCKAASFCTQEQILSLGLRAKLDAIKSMDYPENLETVLNYLCPLLIRGNQATQLTAFKLIQKLRASIQEQEEEQSKAKDEEVRHPPHAIWEVVDTCKEALLLWLKAAEVKIGSKWLPEEGSEELTASMAYLLGWMLILDLFKTASPAVRASYAAYMRDSGSTDALLHFLFCVMPNYPFVNPDTSAASLSGKAGSSLFEIPVNMSLKDVWTCGDLGHYACMAYFIALEELPALVRQWWNKQDRRVADIVDKFTSKFVSPILCEQQIKDVKQEDFDSTNLTVKSRQVTREVIATYSVDEASIELVVTLPANHPLGAVKVEQGKKIGIGLSQWRNWMLQLTTFLQHQNGSIAKGLQLWKRNVDKKFEGVEECYVCYSVIHGTTCQLPRLQCKTCKKKFHSSCLYKWFSTSNNSTCPLCRNLF